MDATFLGDNGKPQHFEMGCYGIGVTRLPAAAVEQNHDERGMIWPDAIAPFTVVICPIGMGRSEAVKTEAEKLYGELLALGVDVILDDRDERPGAMLADWELIGVPHRVVLGDRGLKEGVVEYQQRRDTEATKLATMRCWVTSRAAWACKLLFQCRKSSQPPLLPDCRSFAGRSIGWLAAGTAGRAVSWRSRWPIRYVRLCAAVAGSGAPPELEFTSTEARMSYLRWLVASSDKLAKRKPDLQAGASSCRPSGTSPSARASMCPWSWA
jgi:hypothetical protein